MTVIESFKLPSTLIIQQRLTKKSFYEMGNLSNAQQKLLQEQIDSVKITAHLTADKTNIPIYQTDKHEYLEIFIIEADLKNSQAWSDLPGKQLSTLHEIFHKAIPYPLILLIHSAQDTQLSLAEKLINQADTSSEKLIMNDLIQTNWLNSEEFSSIQQQFLKSLSYDKLNKQNLYTVYQSLMHRFTALLVAEQTGTYTVSDESKNITQLEIDQQRQKLKTLIKLNREITEIKNKIKDCHQFNEKVELNMQLQNLTNQLADIKK
ncbi:DUF4391 domain-containing protein [Hydrogenovibrio sp. 3SP14C1]|uniref:DUF4391 domain-containing protein n=1 Tax=Hydrogenovibrio sp. 3SP14C1 TaxID=3038774 RepID=UPI0024167054|nr:DUF4391 domain-containing protein [Hydrogenovibrio sp. 3SP14C1]MDG4812023.1 DUF4391 domain-containing protein [Hydrogenovibrio sp. 3SP14C1]